MEILKTSTELFLTILEGIIFLTVYISLTDRRSFLKEYKSRTILFIAFYTVFCFWASTYIPQGLHTVAISIFAVILLSSVTKSNIYAAFITIVIMMVFLFCTEITVLIPFMYFAKVNLPTLLDTAQLYVFYGLICKTIQLSLTFLLFIRKLNLFSANFFKRDHSHISLIFMKVFLMILFILSIGYAVAPSGNIVLYQGLLYIICFLVVLLSVIDVVEREKILKTNRLFENQKIYIENLETVVNVIRREKHDFSNHLNTILAMCVLNKPDLGLQIKAYVQKLTKNLTSSYQFYNTANPYIDGLLAVKSSQAFNNSIHLEVDFEAPLSMLQIDDIHLTSIISNIIDNAFDAMLNDTDTRPRVVSVCTYIEDNQFLLSISNTGPKIPQENLERLFDNGFSTKSKDKQDHGFGLFITQQIIKDYRGQITVNSTEDETEFLISFKLKNAIFNAS